MLEDCLRLGRGLFDTICFSVGLSLFCSSNESSFLGTGSSF
jgi:hypothetical protein